MFSVRSHNTVMSILILLFKNSFFFSSYELRDQRLKENDHILAINHTPLDQNISHQQAIALLQQSTGSLHLVVAREPVQRNSRTAAVLSDINPPETVSCKNIKNQILDC